MAEYATPAVMQLYMNSQEDEYLTNNPNITFFKKTYVNPEIFIKDEMVFKDIPMKWDDTTFVKIPRDIHLLGNIWATVNIPYFQILEKITSTSTTTTNNANLNEMIYDNYLTYLVYYNGTYYLIPVIFYEFPDLLFNIFKLKFAEIKEYFNYLTQINIITEGSDTDIIMFSFNMNNYYAHDIIPTLLNLSNTYDKLSLNTVLNGKDRYKQNLLTQNSYDNYITNIIENEVINQYQNISKFDSIIDSSNYNFMNIEFDVLFNNGTSTTSDVYLVNEYINTSNISTVNTIDTISQDTITKTSLVLEYIITDLNPSFEKTYTFYKKYATILAPSIYNFTLINANIIDIDTLGGNLIQQYYPNYAVDLSTLNLPFTLTTNMIITTADGLIVTYIVEGGYDKLKISDSSSTTILDKIKMTINTNNNTLNDVNINLDYNDTNKNNEWNNNLLINLGKLDYNNQLEVLLFYQFKKNYYLKENVIKNNLLTFTSSVNSIKSFWIQLKVISDRFNKRNDLIGFNNDEYIDNISDLINNYPYIINIESEPQDIFNVYAIIVNRLFNTLKNKYFSEYSFIQFFYNKINSLLYQRFKNISNMYTLADFNGLLFYMNIDLLYYISFDIIKNYLSELFSLESYIGYIPLTLTPLNLAKNDINDYMDNSYTNIDTSQYFHELKYNNIYYYTSNQFNLLNIGNVVSIKKEYTNYLFYKSNFVEFQIVLFPNNPLLKTIINVLNYTLDDTYLNLTIDLSNISITDLSTEFYLYETIKSSIPIVKAATSITNEYDKVVVFDKSQQIDLFIAYISVSVDVIPNITICLMVYTLNDTVTTYLCKMSNAWQLLGLDGTNILPLDYKSYDKIELYRINLPTTDVTITNAKLAQDMETTYPNLILEKTSLTINELALFTKLNSFKLTNGANTYSMVIIDDDINNIYLYVYDSNVLTTAVTLTATIYNNSNMPNLFEYTSLDTNICETNDYFIQKPMIINIENDNIYLFVNMPKMLNSNNISSDVFIDNKNISNIYNLDNNQILRDVPNTKLCSTYYQDNCLTDAKYKNDILNIVIDIYNGLYDDIYKSVIDTIEDSQQEYINSHNEILNYIKNTLKLGQTVQNMYNAASILNEYNLTSNISTITINLNDYNLIDFDSFTSLALSLYNFTNKSNNILKVDNTIISALAYKFNTTTKKIINSPWHNYKPYVKINPEVINYFDRYNLYAQTMLTNVINNQSALIVVNNENFPQNYDYEYNIKGNYYNMICNTDKFNITLASIPALNTLASASNDVTLTINNQLVTYDGSNYTISGSNINDKIYDYKYKQIYDKTPVNNMDNYYKLIGAISIVNNEINSDFTLPDLFIADNNVVFSTNTELIFNNNSYGINLNSYKLELSGNSTTKQLFYSPKLLNYYIVEPTIAHPFVAGNDYIITINNINGYLKVNGTKLEILMSSKILFTYDTTINWEISTAGTTFIFLALRFDLFGQLEAITNSYTTTFNIYRYSIFNLFLDEPTLPYTKYIIYNEDNELLYQQYNDQVTILDVVLIYINTQITTIYANYNIIYKEVNTDNSLLPPILIDETINVYNYAQSVIDIINSLDSTSWVKFYNNSNQYEFQIKDFTSQVFNDGNYLFYNSNISTPLVLKHPDIYKQTLNVNNVDFNVYENKITLNTALDPTYPTLEPDLSNGTFTVNNVLINNVDNLDIYLEPVNENLKINLVITDGVNNFDRPIIVTKTPTTLNYIIDTIGVNPLYQGQLDNVMFFPNATFIALVAPELKCRITKSGGGFLTNNLYTYSNLIEIVNVGSLGTTFEIYIKKEANISIYADDYHLIEIFNDNNEKIYLWLYLIDLSTVIYNNLRLVNGATTINFREPYYYNYSGIGALPNSIKSIDYPAAVYYDYVYIDTKYLTLTASDKAELMLPSQTINITITNDNYLNFDETYYKTDNALVATISDSNFSSILNNWSYLYKVNINGYFINNTGLQTYKYFIFVYNNELYFNEKKYNTDIGIELQYEMPNNVVEGEVYVYDYKPIFMTLPYQQFNYLVINKNAYIYCDLNELQRNQIIKIGYDIIQITRWSDYYNCYLGILLYKGSEVSNNTGYYSFGIFTNIYNKNLMLKNINTDSNILFYLDTKANTNDYMLLGDYYIDTNVLKQYTSVLFNTQSNYFYKLPIGVNINIMYIDGEFYYDETCVYLKPLDSMVYNNNIYVIDSLDGNKITFKVSPIVLTQNLIFYVPYQPFKVETIDILNNTIITTDYSSLNGWIEIYGIGIFNVVNGIIDGIIPNNTYTLRIIITGGSEGGIKCDFNNYVVYEESIQYQTYKNLPIKTICTVNLDETYVYLTNTITFPNLKYIYNQSILINNIWYQVINFYGPTSNAFTKVYINELSATTNLQNIKYDIIFSACNVNDNYLLSNKHILRNTAKIEYPKVLRNIDTLTGLYNGGSGCFYTINFTDIVIPELNTPTQSNEIISGQLIQQLDYFSNNNNILSPYYFFENYIPSQINIANPNTYNEVPLTITGNCRYENDYFSFILLKELTVDNYIYQHYIKVNTNNNLLYITNSVNLINKKTSFFFLHNVIPCQITEYNNIILLNPDYNLVRPINVFERQIMNILYKLKVISLLSSPVKSNKKWKYYIKIGQLNSSLSIATLLTKDLLINNIYSCTIEATADPTKYYIYSDNYINDIEYLSFTDYAYIDEISKDKFVLKDEFNKIDTENLNKIIDNNNIYKFKQNNRLMLSLVNNEYLLDFYDNSTPIINNVNLGDIDNTNSVGLRNIINYSTINTNIDYVLTTKYSILDINSTPKLYNIITDYTRTNPFYYIIEPEISITIPSLEAFLNDENINMTSIVNQYKDWRNWTLITTRYNANLEPYLENYDLVYDGFNYTTDTSTSYFTSEEITTMKAFMKFMYKNNPAISILNELYLVEQYLLDQISHYITQKYFWKDIINILKKIVANYNGLYSWTITNNVLCIEDEFINYPDNFTLNNSNNISNYVRNNYLSRDFDIYYNSPQIDDITIGRDPTLIDTNIGYLISSNQSINLYGTNMNNIIITLLNFAECMNTIPSKLPINFNYMDSNLYLIANIFNKVNSETEYNFNALSKLERVATFDSQYNYYGKYYDNLFNERYFGIDGFNQYTTLLDSTNSIFVKDNIIYDLYNSSDTNTNNVNKLKTNNIFKYTVLFDNKGYESNELIKSSNKYTIDIKDNFNHMVDPLIENAYINTDNFSFDTTEMVQPTDVSIISNEYYTSTNINYGYLFNVTINSTIDLSDSSYKLYYNDSIVLYYDNTYKLAFNNVVDILSIESVEYDETIPKTTIYLSDTSDGYYEYIYVNETIYSITRTASNIYTISSIVLISKNNYYAFYKIVSPLKVSYKVVVKTVIKSSNRTFLTFSSNYNSSFIYIIINNIPYELVTLNNLIYIDDLVDVLSNELYEVFTNIDILTYSITNEQVSDLILDRDINPIKYNQTDINLPLSFTIKNCTISNLSILTNNKLRIKYIITEGYNINSILDTNVTHIYRLNESIPYRINSITPLNQYYYELNNNWNIRLIDSINLGGNDAIIYKVTDSTIYFYLTTYIVAGSFVPPVLLTMVKDYNLTIISYIGNKIIADIPSGLVNSDNIFELVDINNNIHPATVNFGKYLDIITDSGIIITNIILRQTIVPTTYSIKEPTNNQAYKVLSYNDTQYENLSPYFIPVIQTLDNSLNEFDAKYFYKFNYNSAFTFSTNVNVYNDIFINCLVIMIQNSYAIIGSNTYINPGTYTIYSFDYSEKLTNIILENASYLYIKGDILEQISGIEYTMLFPNGSLYYYDIFENTTTNNNILTFKYTLINLYNNSYKYVGFNKVSDTISTVTTNNTKYNDVEWIENMAIHLFKSIEFIIDDVIIEKFDSDIYTIFGNYILNMFKREEGKKLYSIRTDTDGNFYLNLIIPLFFTYTYQYLPISNMNNSTIKIKFVLNSLSNLIKNNKKSEAYYTNYVNPSIDFNYSFMTTDKMILDYFNNKEILISNFYYYQNYLLNKLEEYNHVSLLTKVREIFFITKTAKGDNTPKLISTKEYDVWYSEYLSNNINDEYIFNLVDAEIAAKTNRYTIMIEHPIISKYDVRFAMYLDSKYLVYINENLNNSSLKYSYKLTVLSLYFTNNYKNITINTPVNIIDSLNIWLNGVELLPDLPSSYHNYVIPYLKGMALPNSYHTYSFGYYSLTPQPNGFINMKLIKDFLIYTKQTEINSTWPEYRLKICTREYKVLKIENNKGKLIS